MITYNDIICPRFPDWIVANNRGKPSKYSNILWASKNKLAGAWHGSNPQGMATLIIL